MSVVSTRGPDVEVPRIGPGQPPACYGVVPFARVRILGGEGSVGQALTFGHCIDSRTGGLRPFIQRGDGNGYIRQRIGAVSAVRRHHGQLVPIVAP